MLDESGFGGGGPHRHSLLLALKETTMALDDDHKTSYSITIHGGNVTIAPHSSFARSRGPAAELSPRQSWRESLATLVREKADELQIDESMVCELASRELRGLGVRLSLDSMNERDLGLIFETLSKLKRPALK